MVKALRKTGWQADAGLRKSNLQEQGTGEMSVLTLGFATGKIGAIRTLHIRTRWVSWMGLDVMVLDCAHFSLMLTLHSVFKEHN